MNTRTIPLPQGYRYFWFDEIDSTNQEALRRCADGHEPNCWFRADQQTMGRGTKGSKWISQAGNLHASLFVRSSCRPDQLAQISILAALAAITAIEQVASEQFHIGDLCLKWPNDVLLNGRKICGILVESRPSREEGFFEIIIGFGINLAINPKIEGIVPAGNLSECGWSCSREELFVALVQSTRDWLSIWQHGSGFETLRPAWLERSCHIGQTITVMAGDKQHVGRMTSISKNGALVLEDNASHETILSSGNITKIEK